MTLEPTFYGYVATNNDALLIFEATRGNQILSKVDRFPHNRERDRLIRSGNIFVFDDQSSNIRRWDDGPLVGCWAIFLYIANSIVPYNPTKRYEPGNIGHQMADREVHQIPISIAQSE
jgi:Gti1/Pac2 family transcription factor